MLLIKARGIPRLFCRCSVVKVLLQSRRHDLAPSMQEVAYLGHTSYAFYSAIDLAALCMSSQIIVQ